LNQINITFNDGKKRSFNQGVTVLDIIKSTFPNSYLEAVAVVSNGQYFDLSTKILNDTEIQVLSYNDPDGLQIFWHSSSHILAYAVKSLYPDAKLGIGPAISNGFYYDFQFKNPLSSEDLIQIEKKMQEIVKADRLFTREELHKDEAISIFKERKEDFKIELIQDIEGEMVTVYKNNGFLDLCRGPHVPSTGYIRYFKLLSIAGSYWRGDERNAVLQRIYGIAFPSKKTLSKHLLDLEEAKKRDHRKLGKELDLFSFQPEGPGFPFWHPNGSILYNEIMNYMRVTLQKHGYEEIRTPLILNEALWHQSGHWDNYKENMYFTNIDEQPYAVKPMNCPGGLLVYKNTPHSYKEFPIRTSEMGVVHRHEKSGVLHGLFRVRQFTQDDAHIFCTPEQMEDEIIGCINLVEEVYHNFGFVAFQVELSTRPAKSIGSDDMWQRAEKTLNNALSKKKIDFQVNHGEGAFYGPKIDYHVKDSLGRMWQCGTIQLDFSMPERFELEYIGPDNDKHRPVMIHRAILGSVERFIGILIEHYGGAFPLWLAPVQCIFLPISEKHHKYAENLFKQTIEQGIRCKLDNRNEKIGYKIREAEVKKIPYMFIIGDKELESQSVSVRKRKEGDLGTQSLDQFLEFIKNQIQRRA